MLEVNERAVTVFARIAFVFNVDLCRCLKKGRVRRWMKWKEIQKGRDKYMQRAPSLSNYQISEHQKAKIPKAGMDVTIGTNSALT